MARPSPLHLFCISRVKQPTSKIHFLEGWPWQANIFFFVTPPPISPLRGHAIRCIKALLFTDPSVCGWFRRKIGAISKNKIKNTVDKLIRTTSNRVYYKFEYACYNQPLRSILGRVAAPLYLLSTSPTVLWQYLSASVSSL
jgi:hypothetical protein